jgi:hypothetical protein
LTDPLFNPSFFRHGLAAIRALSTAIGAILHLRIVFAAFAIVGAFQTDFGASLTGQTVEIRSA